MSDDDQEATSTQEGPSQSASGAVPREEPRAAAATSQGVEASGQVPQPAATQAPSPLDGSADPAGAGEQFHASSVQSDLRHHERRLSNGVPQRGPYAFFTDAELRAIRERAPQVRGPIWDDICSKINRSLDNLAPIFKKPFGEDEAVTKELPS